MSNILNPLDGLTAVEIIALIRELIIDDGSLSHEDLCEQEDRLEAIVTALAELRDAGYQAMTFHSISEAESLDWFFEAADDERLSPLVRQNCKALRDRYLVQGVKRLLGHLPSRN